MKLIVFSAIVLLGIGMSLAAPDVRHSQITQQPNEKLRQLETQLKKVDEEGRELKVKVKGEKESNATIEVKAEGGNPLNIDLSTIEVSDDYVDQQVKAAFSENVDNPRLPNIKVMQVGASKDYEVVDDYPYNSSLYTITVPKGFVYDRASIPRIFWVAIDKDSLSNVAPVFHDLLYRNGGVLPKTQVVPYKTFSRKETDDLFFELMIKAGVKEWRAKLAYQAVRRFAEGSWRERAK